MGQVLRERRFAGKFLTALGDPSVGVRSTPLTKNCVTGFQYGATPDGGKTLVKLGTARNPAATAASGVTNLTAQFTQGPPYDAVVYYARTMGLDGNGNVVYPIVAVAPSAQVTPAWSFNLAITVR